ncbi:MAG: hypothetical protein RIS13_1331 [Bacteroidota bacterium]|jgi:uncharacterized protein YndB with AHSA1/START domain
MSKQLFSIEYPVRCSPNILYDFLSTPAGLQEWFAEKVDERDTVFSFSWNGSVEKAEVLEAEQNKFIRFHWLHAPQNEYFEFSIEKTEVSSQTILIIKDFAEKKEIPDQSRLWGVQVHDLFHRLGN